MATFGKEEMGTIIKITCPMNLDDAAAVAFSDQAKAWMLCSAEKFVIDFKSVANISRGFYSAMIQLKSTLKRDEKTLHALNLSRSMLAQIQTAGMVEAFSPIKSIEELQPKAKAAASINVDFINPFLAATLKTLEVQCQTKVKALKPFLKTGPIPNVDIAGVLTLTSHDVTGSIVLCFPTAVFLKIYENMFGEKHTSITRETEDAAGELLNIIYGLAKTELNNKGFNFQKALPTVLVGEKLNIRQTGPARAVIVPFEVDGGQLHIEVEYSKGSGVG